MKNRGVAAAAFIFALLALIALAVTPAIMLRRLTEQTTDITTTVLPAFNSLSAFLFTMEERVSSARSAAFTGDTVYIARFARAREREAEALDTLSRLAPEFGPTFERRLEALKRFTAQRDALETVIDTTSSEAAQLAMLPRFDALHDSILVQAVVLRRELVRAGRAEVAVMSRWASLQGRLSLILGALAVIAALIVGWFAWLEQQQRRQTQTALLEAQHQHARVELGREELQRVNESRIRLLRGITHDVKNPIGAAKGYADLLAMSVKAPLDPEQAPLVEGISRTLDNALAIIDDLLDFARAESGGFNIRQVPVDFGELVEEAIEDHRATASAAGHTIITHFPAQPIRVCSDPARIRQVIGNVMSNAIKYTPPPGRITVKVEVIGDGPGSAQPGRAALRISDTGPGVPSEVREAIFDEFSRLGENGVKGHGIGLAISRRIARLLNGDLALVDLDRPGATFLFWLPIARSCPDGTA